MKNKVVSLYGKSNPKNGVNYSELLENFLDPFLDEFGELEEFEYIIEFGRNDWNLGNLTLLMPTEFFDEEINGEVIDVENKDLLARMIEYKILHFKNYPLFISDFELEEKKGELVVTVTTQDKESYLAAMLVAEDSDMDFEEGDIDRFAIIVKPLQPFIDWYLKLYPDDPEELEELRQTRTYLLSDEVENEEAWLRKKFDKIFQLELESFHSNKKEWPQKRNYKMFKEWLRVEISTMVYDCEGYPISKF